MVLLRELYLALRTRNSSDAETDDSPELVVQRSGEILFAGRLFGSYLSDRGAGAIFRFDVVEAKLDSADLDLELRAHGHDAWSPEHIIIWGIAGERPEERVVPLGAMLDLADPLTSEGSGLWLSEDTSEGELVLPIQRVDRGQASTLAQRLIVITATDQYGALFPAAAGPGGDPEDTGTRAALTLQAGVPGRLMLSYQLPGSPQSDQERGGAGLYVVDLAAPLSRNDLRDARVTLTIGSNDWWKPDYFAAFGADSEFFGPAALIPFVAASAFELKQMSTDPTQGWHSIVLPKAKVVPRLPNDPGGNVGGNAGVFEP
jgi:hypothetical protein